MQATIAHGKTCYQPPVGPRFDLDDEPGIARPRPERTLTLEERVPDDHPLRLIREIVNDVLGSLSSEFETLYSHMGRPSIPPEKLLRALLLQAFHSIRSERQLMEQLNFNMLFRWFVGLGLDDGVWDASAFCHNRDRLLEAEVSGQLLAGVIQHTR